MSYLTESEFIAAVREVKTVPDVSNRWGKQANFPRFKIDTDFHQDDFDKGSPWIMAEVFQGTIGHKKDRLALHVWFGSSRFIEEDITDVEPDERERLAKAALVLVHRVNEVVNAGDKIRTMSAFELDRELAFRRFEQ